MKLKGIEKKLLGDIPIAERFDYRLVLYTSLLSALISFFGIIINTSIGLKPLLILIPCITFVVYTSLFLILRKSGKLELVKWLMTILTLIIINVFWYYNYNSQGPVLYLFIVFYSFLLFVYTNKQAIYLFLVLLLNLVVLLYIETQLPQLLSYYPNHSQRIFDMYSGLVVYFAIIYLFTYYAKRNYQLQYEKVKDAERFKTAFLNNLSHEIRTPLNAIIGFSNLIVSDKKTFDFKQSHKNIIAENSEYLLRLVEDIIETSKIETNQFLIKKVNVDIKHILIQQKEIFDHIIRHEKKAIKTLINLPPEELVIRSDKTRIEQVLNNILQNAIKFTKSGNIKFGAEKTDNAIRFFVSDTGIGIKPEHHEQIFERFTKIENSNGTLYRGSGIGLYLSRRIIELLGGRIWVESEFGKGATFYFTLPLTKPEG